MYPKKTSGIFCDWDSARGEGHHFGDSLLCIELNLTLNSNLKLRLNRQSYLPQLPEESVDKSNVKSEKNS